MNIIKISNLYRTDGLADYKGLNLEFIQSGTQIYPEGSNEAYFYYSGEVVTNGDITVIDEATYNTIKQNEENKPKSPSIEDRLASVEDAITSLMGV